MTHSPIELHGWDQIANHLSVSRRTVQKYERDFGLPIRRTPGAKGRVWATAVELDRWRENQQSRSGVQPISGLSLAQGQELHGECLAPQPGYSTAAITSIAEATRQNPFRRISVLFAIAALLLLTGYGIRKWSRWNLSRVIADFRVQGRDLIAIDGRGSEIWRHHFAVPLVETVYRPEAVLAHTWLGRLGNENEPSLIFTAAVPNAAEVGTDVYCFGADGRIKWRFTPGRKVRDSSGYMVPPYSVFTLQVIPGKSPAETRIAVSSIHYQDQPGQVAFLDIWGRVVGEYWHPGHLNHSAVADLFGDGRGMLLLGGVNNGNHQATLVVLDPLSVKGLMTPKEMHDHRFELLDMPAAKERAVVFFPRSCVSIGQAYTRVSLVLVNKQRIVVNVAEGESEAASPQLFYELDYGLRVLAVGPAEQRIRQTHQALEAKHLLDHPYSQELECARLKAGVVVRWQ
jgi:hypothetical protein